GRSLRSRDEPLDEEIAHAQPARRARRGGARREDPRLRRRDQIIGVRQARSVRSRDGSVDQRTAAPDRAPRAGRRDAKRQDLRDRRRPEGRVRADGCRRNVRALRAMHDYRALARYAVFAVFALSVAIASAAWLVRARHVSPFGTLGRMLRAASDPAIRPVEGRLVRRVSVLPLDAARLRPHRLAGGTDPPRAAAHGSRRLEPAGSLAGPLGAQAAAPQRGVSLSAARIVVHVAPRARRTEVAGRHGDGIRVRIAAPPVDGAANAELTRFLAERLGVPRRAVTIVSGAGGRRKIVQVAGPATGAAVHPPLA